MVMGGDIGGGGGIHLKRAAIPVVLFVLCLLMYLLFSNISLPSNVNLQSAPTSKWLPYRHQTLMDQEWFEGMCIERSVPSVVEDLPSILEVWRTTKDLKCKKVYLVFIRILSIKSHSAQIKVPDTFKSKVKGWLGDREDLYNEVLHQKVLMFYNKYTREQNTYNPIRSKRPISAPAIPERQYIDNLVKETQTSCDFCRYKQYTATDMFGRIESNLSFSASNTFKLDRWHDLFLLRTHHPLNWTLEQFLDLVATSQKWFTQVYRLDPEFIYPSTIWDVMPKAGASQIHPHMHGFLDTGSYQGMMEQWRRGAEDYNIDYPGTNYFTDIVQIHTLLGLAVTYGKATAFANLVPKLSNEVVIISDKPNKDFFLLVYFVIRAFLDDMPGRNLVFSSGIAYPSMTGDTSSKSLPVYMRIVTRGSVSEIRSDESSLELFTSSNANTDQYNVIKYIRQSVVKRSVK